VESKIHRLVKYYKSKGVLSQDWKYSLEAASQLVD
jgi:small subunit ribosomal protein S15